MIVNLFDSSYKKIGLYKDITSSVAIALQTPEVVSQACSLHGKGRQKTAIFGTRFSTPVHPRSPWPATLTFSVRSPARLSSDSSLRP